MNEKILFVDDESNVLDAIRRQLHRRFCVETAIGGAQALTAVVGSGPYAVIVADMRMPYMDGAQFLKKVREIAPDTVRMMLTGNADQQTAIDAVNEGHIFRFLNKPCPAETLIKALEAGVEQYELITARAELLEKTLVGATQVLTEILSLADPQAFGRAMRLKKYALEVAGMIGYEESWELQLAAMLCRIGQVAIPSSVVDRARDGGFLTEPEAEMLARVPMIGRDFLQQIPRLEEVARIVYYQEKGFDGSGSPPDAVSGAEIPRGARVLKILSDLVAMESAGTSKLEALELLRTHKNAYDPEILEALYDHWLPGGCPQGQEVTTYPVGSESPLTHGAPVFAQELILGDVLVCDLETSEGALLFPAGHVVTEMSLEKLRNYRSLGDCVEINTLVFRNERD
ncbi:MAG TPA: HD domain-containing phosphohydrolase [Chthonomonadaceae bacterium]|nr:HD domain-containing phosphohydrolase [Chthonomonadaceae bacterium]